MSKTGHASRDGPGPRRSPARSERKRDPERTRERILDAAAAEFAAKGFAGARVAGIAERAGVNQQLISYYFGGKQGLYDELSRRWQAAEGSLAHPDLPLDQVVAGYFDASVAQPEWARMLLWQALGDSPGEARESAQRMEIGADLADVRRRQQAGELTGELPAEFILLVLWAAAMAPVALPQVVRGGYGCEPGSPEFRARYLPALQRLFRAARMGGQHGQHEDGGPAR